MMKLVRLDIVGADPLFRECLAVTLGNDRRFQVASHGSDFETAKKNVEDRAIDLVLIDSSNAVDATCRLVRRAMRNDVKALVLGGEDDHAAAVRFLEAGARGFMDLSSSFDELGTAIETTLAGGVASTPGVVQQMLTRLSELSNADLRRRRVSPTAMTPREREILGWIAEGLTNQEIAEKLHLSAHTVKNHLYQLFKKLEVSSRSQAIRVASERGWLERLPEER